VPVLLPCDAPYVFNRSNHCGKDYTFRKFLSI
jgi:hypothetical protein